MDKKHGEVVEYTDRECKMLETGFNGRKEREVRIRIARR